MASKIQLFFLLFLSIFSCLPIASSSGDHHGYVGNIMKSVSDDAGYKAMSLTLELTLRTLISSALADNNNITTITIFCPPDEAFHSLKHFRQPPLTLLKYHIRYLCQKQKRETGYQGFPPILKELEICGGNDFCEEQNDLLPLQSSCVAGLSNVVQGVNSALSRVLPNPSCNMNLGFPIGQVNSSMSVSLSNLSCESSAADYQDCGVSPLFLQGESPWDANMETSSPQARDKAKMRYKEKKKNRT
ncbi:Zinc finger protein constans-like, partial [Thalictrum thalictroides]